MVNVLTSIAHFLLFALCVNAICLPLFLLYERWIVRPRNCRRCGGHKSFVLTEGPRGLGRRDCLACGRTTGWYQFRDTI